MKRLLLITLVLFSFAVAAQDQPVEKGKFRDVLTPIDTLANGNIVYGEFVQLSIRNVTRDDSLGVVYSKLETVYKVDEYFNGECKTCEYTKNNPQYRKVITTSKAKIEAWDANLGDTIEQSILYDIRHNEGLK